MYSLVVSHGHNCIIEDIDGNKYLDFTSNIGSCPLGYSHTDIIETLAAYSSNGTYEIAGQDFYCQEHADIAENISTILPVGFKTFFINSSAEAVENAIKITYRKRGPLPGISCIGTFHGRTRFLLVLHIVNQSKSITFQSSRQRESSSVQKMTSQKLMQ